MGKGFNRNWVWDSEIRSLAALAMDAAHALSETFDRSDSMWEEEHLPEDPSHMVELSDAARDLAAKSLVLMGVQEGSGPNARIVRFAEAHREEAAHAVAFGRPLSPIAVTAALRDWGRCRETACGAARNAVKVHFPIDWPGHAVTTLRTAVMIVTRPNSIKLGSLPDKTRLFVLSNMNRLNGLGIDVFNKNGGTVLVRDRNGDCDPEMIARLLHNIISPISFRWSEHCPEDPEALASGGGALVSVHGVRIFHATDLLESAMQAAYDELCQFAGM